MIMNILYFEVGKDVINLDVENNLNVLQNLIGGYIDVVKIDPKKKIILVRNEEARILHLPINKICKNFYEPIYGNFFICQFDGEEFCAIDENNISEVKGYFK